MPAYVTVKSDFDQTAAEANAMMCDLGIAGPDHRVAVPVRFKLISDRMLTVDNKPHQIISAVRENGTITYLIAGSTKDVRNRERRVALARALTLLQQTAEALRPLRATSKEPELVTEGLQLLFDWIAAEGARDDAR
jgi:hypothetical protein